MEQYQYLIVGGGMTADAAVQGIREHDKKGRIGILSSDQHPPYNRPPLSKGLWKGDSLEKVWRKASSESAELFLTTTAKSIEIANRRVVDDRGREFGFEKLLLATGGRVRRLPGDVPGIIYYRTLDDFQRLKALTADRQSFAVIGGGFIGSEVAAALAMNRKSVTMIFPDDGIGTRVYPPALSQFLNEFYRSKGVELLTGESVANIELLGDKYVLTVTGGSKVTVDAVVAGIGIKPNVDLAQSIGLTVENGIQVNDRLQTAQPFIYSAGDVANFYNSSLGNRIRVEHEDNANASGKIAGMNMAGADLAYDYLPFFYSDLFELGYEAVGETDSRLETLSDWKEELREGVVYYLRDQMVRGVLLWNVWGQVERARELIAAKEQVTVSSLIGRIDK